MEYEKKGLDGLVPMRKFSILDKKTGFRDGIGILVHRLGLSGAKVQALARDRYPAEPVGSERCSLKTFKIRCFLKFDIVFSDILHTDNKELKFIGMGRRYLINKLLRNVVAGICDSLDKSGKSGDFTPRSWMDERTANRVKTIQKEAISIVKVDNKKLLQSVKVRLRRVSTNILEKMVDNASLIRKKIKESTNVNKASGLKKFSEILLEFKDRLYKTTHRNQIRFRKKYRLRRTVRASLFRKKRKKGQRRGIRLKTGKIKNLNKTKKMRKSWLGSSILTRGLTDLRMFMDPKVVSWYRRPSDDDWYEGIRSERRKPRTFNRKVILKRYGLGMVPGITEPVTAEEWHTLRTDWRTKEVRELYRRHLKELKELEELEPKRPTLFDNSVKCT